MARSPDCMLRLESLEWHAGTPVTTIGCAIQAGGLPATGRPRRVRAADFEAWLVRQSMDGGKRHKRRGELDRWRQRYPDGEPAPFESYPVAAPPIEAEQLPLAQPAEAPQAAPPVDHYHRELLLRVLAAVEEGASFDELDGDILQFWDDGACFEGRVLYFKAKLELAEDFLMLARAPSKPRHGALTEDEIAKLEAA